MRSQLQRLLVEHLRKINGLSHGDAETVVRYLEYTIFRPAPRNRYYKMSDVECLLGFSFGGRHDTNLNISYPGPQNEAIARLIEKTYKTLQGRVHVFVQWEIGLVKSLRETIDKNNLTIMHPPVDPITAKHTHYSTKEVWREIVNVMNKYTTVMMDSPIGIFAHRLHLPRVIACGHSLNMKHLVYPAEGLPSDFDPESAYPWLRDPLGAFLSGAISSMAAMRNDMYCRDSMNYPQSE